MISATVLNEITSRHEFHVGFGRGVSFALIAAAAGVVCTVLLRRPAPIAGLVVVLAFVTATQPAHALSPDVSDSGALPASVTHGLLLLAIAGLVTGLLAAWFKPLALVGLVLTFPGAMALTSDTGLPDRHWVAPLVVLTTVVGGTFVADFDRRHAKRGWGVVMFAVSVVGVYFTVPDTELALVLLGASIPLVLLGWPFPITSLGSVGAYPAVGALAWTAAFEGLGRPSSIVAGCACLGLFVVEPVTRVLLGLKRTIFDALPARWWLTVPIALLHLLLVFVASRIAGLRAGVSQATTIVIAELVTSVAFLWLLQAEITPAQPRTRRADQ